MYTDPHAASATKRKTANLRRLASRVSLGIAIILVAIKLLAWILTGSVALLAAAIDALVDTAAAFTTFFGVRYAERPADQDHRFGHGKGEAIAGFTQAAFLAGAAIVLAFQSVERLFQPQPVEHLGLGLVVIIASLATAAGLVVLQGWVVRRTGSTAIAADRAHYLTDVGVNLAVLASLAITRLTGAQRVDPAFALAIFAYMLWNSRHIAIDALKQLLDQELPDAERARIRTKVMACYGVRGMHDLRTRSAGDRIFIEFHLEVDGDISVARAHFICDSVEMEVERLFSTLVEVSAHLEPAGIEDERLDNLVNREGR